MPRHRRERVPLHRAQRQADNPARRGALSAVAATAGTLLENSGPDDGEGADGTQPLPPVRVPGPRHSTTVHRARHPATSGPSLLSGAARGLLVTPWFAAATGFVLAAALWIYSPHTELKLGPPSNAIGVVPCQQAGCGVTTEQGARSLTATSRQPLVHPSKSASHSAVPRRSAAAGLTFTYAVVWQQPDDFAVMITVTGKRSIRDWRLAFAMPGDQISKVVGASFTAAGRDAGTASDMGDQATGDGGHDGPGSPDASGDMYAISFMVVGQGTPVLPTDCSYDGASCTFK
jgi:hypothetical protein